MLNEIMSDLKPFFVILTVYLLAFGCSMLILTGKELNWGTAFFSQWLLSFGEFDPSIWEKYQGHFFFLISTCNVTLILMNLIIAIMSDTYVKVMSQQKLYNNHQLS